jgi:hypothetical protein
MTVVNPSRRRSHGWFGHLGGTRERARFVGVQDSQMRSQRSQLTQHAVIQDEKPIKGITVERTFNGPR